MSVFSYLIQINKTPAGFQDIFTHNADLSQYKHKNPPNYQQVFWNNSFNDVDITQQTVNINRRQLRLDQHIR